MFSRLFRKKEEVKYRPLTEWEFRNFLVGEKIYDVDEKGNLI